MRCCITVICASARGGHVTNLLLQGSVLPPHSSQKAGARLGKPGWQPQLLSGAQGVQKGMKKGRRNAPPRCARGEIPSAESV